MTINELREKRNQAWNAAKAFASKVPWVCRAQI